MDRVTSLYHSEHAKKYRESKFIIWRVKTGYGQIIEYMHDYVNGGTHTRVLPGRPDIPDVNIGIPR